MYTYKYDNIYSLVLHVSLLVSLFIILLFLFYEHNILVFFFKFFKKKINIKKIKNKYTGLKKVIYNKKLKKYIRKFIKKISFFYAL